MPAGVVDYPTSARVDYPTVQWTSKLDWGSGLPQPDAEKRVRLRGVTTDAHRAESLQRLPLPYATALRMRYAGIDDEVIAECVGVDMDALPTFMRVAEAKLAAASHEPTA
jgi:hypothetical protein